jgi:hypothetical protein
MDGTREIGSHRQGVGGTTKFAPLRVASSVLDLVTRQVRLGFSGLLLLLDLLLVVLFWWDLVEFRSQGFSLYGAARLLGKRWADGAFDASLLVLAGLLIVPLFLAATRVMGMRFPISLYRFRPRTVTWFHIVTLLPIFCIGLFLEASMRLLSGYEISGALVPQPLFPPRFERLVHLFGNVLVGVPSYLVDWRVLVSLVAFTLMALLGYQKWPEFYTDYWLGSRLADIDPFFLPSSAAERNYLGPRYIAPETKGIRREVEASLRSFYDCGGCTKPSQELLAATVARTKKLVVDVLFPPGMSASDFAVRFAPDYSRCLFAALALLPEQCQIVFLPFLNDSASDLAKSWSELRRRSVHFVPKSGLPWIDDWEKEESRILDYFAMNILVDDSRIMVVTGEIDDLTGMVLPISSLVCKLAKKGYRAEAAVDVTTSVGNKRTLQFFPGAKIYFFVVNQWLVSNEPCGVLIFPEKESGPLGQDSWEESIAYAPTNLRSIRALESALTFVRDIGGFDALWVREEILSRKFREGIAARFEVVGDTDHMERSFVVTVRPARGYHWTSDVYLRAEQQGLSLCFSPGTPEALFTATFPYYVNLWRINRVCQLLNNAVEI